jgi:hypothetical protein
MKMKVKSLAMLAASGLMAASLVYVVPAFAEEVDEIDAGPMQLALADDSTPRTPDASAANNAENAVNPAENTNTASNNSAGVNPASANPAEQGTPDVASGDDDY